MRGGGLAAGVRVLTDCLFAPNLAESEFEHERALAIAELRRADDDKFSLTYRKFLELFYRGISMPRCPRGMSRRSSN